MNLNPLSSNYLRNVGGLTKVKKTTKTPTKTPNITHKHSHSPYKQAKPNPTRYRGYYSTMLATSFELQGPQAFSHFNFCQEGYMFAYTTSLGKITGRAIIIFPEGIIANCNIHNQQIHGWAVIFKRNVFVNISYFRRGKFQGPQYTHNIQKGVMVEALYKNGKMHSLIQCLHQNQTSFENFIGNKGLSELLKQTHEGDYFDRYYPRVQSALGNYYGEKIGNIPCGLGVLIASPQIFYGQFCQGLLQGYGTMIFGNGTFCYGQFSQGYPQGFNVFLKKNGLICTHNDTLITVEQLKSNLKVGSFREDDRIRSLFQPIIQFYEKLKVLYIQCEYNQSQLSLVDIQVANEEGQGQANQHSKSRDSSSQMLTDRMSSQPLTSPVNNRDIQQTFKKPPGIENLTFKKKDIPSPKNQTQTLIKQKKDPKKKKRILVTEQEWDEVIEQLDAQDSVGLQGGFMVPKSQVLGGQDNDEVIMKESSLRTSEGRQNVVKLGKEGIYGNDKQQVKVGRIIGQLSKQNQPK